MPLLAEMQAWPEEPVKDTAGMCSSLARCPCYGGQLGKQSKGRRQRIASCILLKERV